MLYFYWGVIMILIMIEFNFPPLAAIKIQSTESSL